MKRTLIAVTIAAGLSLPVAADAVPPRNGGYLTATSVGLVELRVQGQGARVDVSVTPNCGGDAYVSEDVPITPRGRWSVTIPRATEAFGQWGPLTIAGRTRRNENKIRGHVSLPGCPDVPQQEADYVATRG